MGDLTYLRKELAANADRREKTAGLLERLTIAVREGRVEGLFIMGYAESKEPDVEFDLYGHITLNREGNVYTLLGLVEAQIQNVKELSAAVLVDDNG